MFNLLLKPIGVIVIVAFVLTVNANAKSVSNRDTKQSSNVKQQYLSLFKASSSRNRNSLDFNVDTSKIARLAPKDELFGYLIPEHRQAVDEIAQLLANQPSIERSLELAEYLKDKHDIHPVAWYYAVTSWSLSEPKLQAVPKPSPLDVMPDSFINAEAMEKAEEIRERRRNGIMDDECVAVNGEAGIDNGRDNDVWYWREDLMNNAFHMFYHLYYNGRAGREDRRSESFYLLHRDIIARMDAERIANGLPRTESLVWYRGSVIEEGFDPHLNASLTGRRWGKRAPNTPLPFDTQPLDQALVSERRIYESIIADHVLVPDGSLLPINNIEGVDVLGDLIESNRFSVNPGYYAQGGSLHGANHRAIASINEPGEGDGVMQDVSVSFRDPVFYRWHLYINDIFDANKQRLRPYTPNGGELPLVWSGVSLESISVDTKDSPTTNELFTFFGERRFQLRGGLDHHGDFDTPVDVCAKHLNHEDFVYKILVNSNSFFTRPATVRIFLVPHADEKGVPFSMREQRDLIFTLDVFQTTLDPGENIIYREASASAVTIPWLQSLDELQNGTDATLLCGCGLPQHLNIPRGRVEGMAFDLVAMVTNFVDDAVDYEEPICRSGYVYCGLPNTKYPDAKPMGYPFDRLPYNVDENGNPTENGGTPVRDLGEYVRHVPNMATRQVTITHLGDRTGKHERP